MSDEYTQTKPSLTNPTIVSLFLKPILSSFYGLGFIAFAFGLELQSGPSLFSESSGTNDIFFLCSLSLFSLVSSDVGLFGPLHPTGEMTKLCCVVLRGTKIIGP